MPWSSPPNFQPSDSGRNQIFSAYGHGNALIDDVDYIHGIYSAINIPFATYRIKPTHNLLNVNYWHGYIYKTDDTFRYDINAITTHDLEIKITYGSVTHTITGISTGSPTDTNITGTIDVSSLDNGKIYEVKVERTSYWNENDDYFIVRDLWHETNDISGLPTLAAFSNGDTPTSSEWQQLSDQLTELHTCQISHSVVGLRYYVRVDTSQWIYAYYSKIRHKFDKLYIALDLWGPYANGTTTISLIYNGTTIKTLSAGSHDYVNFYGSIDISSLGLTVGDTYDLMLKMEYTGDYDEFSHVILDSLYEYQDSSSIPSGWSTMPQFVANQTIDGDNDIKKIRDNIEYLKSRVSCRNHAVMEPDDYGTKHYIKRKYRYLAYWTDDSSATIELKFNIGGEEKTITLPNDNDAMSGGNVLLYDLDSSSCYPGTFYHVSGSKFSQEFDNA